MYPIISQTTPYTGNRRRIQIHYVHYTGSACVAPRTSPILSALCVLLLMFCAAFALTRPAHAADLTPTDRPNADIASIISALNAANPEPTAPKTLIAPPTTPTITALKTETKSDATYIYINCPIEAYQGTPYDNEPVEYLVDNFEELPEHWLYVLMPLEDDESYIFTLDLACRIENSHFEGEITATYNSYVPDDGSLGSITIEATEEIAPNLFLVYRGELKYISDGNLHLIQNGYGSLHDHHLFYFTLATADPDLPEGIVPLSEQRISRLSTPSVSADVKIIGNAECADNVYDTNLLESDYMYPYKKYEPAQETPPENTPAETAAPEATATLTELSVDASAAAEDGQLSDTSFEDTTSASAEPAAPGSDPVELTVLSDEPIIFLAEYLTPPDLAHPAVV